ncbi:MAG: hypothetical protein AAGC88_15380, partial [Bacteroidota bacterium]
MKVLLLVLGLLVSVQASLFSQNTHTDTNDQQSTILLFRTFNLFDFGFNYSLYMDGDLLCKMKTKNVFMVDTDKENISLLASTKAPSLNADKRTNYTKTKELRKSISLGNRPIQFVKCGFYNVNLFDLPRQPMVRVLKPEETQK